MFSSTKNSFLSSISKKRRGLALISKTSPILEASNEDLMSRDDLHKSIAAFEELLKSFDQLREFSLRYGHAARDYAKNLKECMSCVKGEDQKMYALVLSSSAGYFDAFALAQEKLTKSLFKHYNSLNSYAEKYFLNLASEEASLEALTVNLDLKLKRLAETFHAQGSNAPDSYVYKIQSLSTGINRLKLSHSKKCTHRQKEVNAIMASNSAKLALCGYAFLSEAIISCGGSNGIGGINAYAPFCQRDVIPPPVLQKNRSLKNAMPEFEVGDEYEYPQQDRPPSSFAMARRRISEKERYMRNKSVGETDGTSKRAAEVLRTCRNH